jgi:uncharacterized protein
MLRCEIYQFRWLILVFLILGLTLLTPYIKEASHPNNDIAIWFNPLEPVLIAYQDYQKEFGNDRVITLSFQDSAGILQPTNLLAIHQFTNAIQILYGVISVESLTNARDFQRIAEQDGMTRIKYAQVLHTDSLAGISEAKRTQILSSSLLSNRFINADGSATLIIIRATPDSNTDSLINGINSKAALHLTQPYYLNGVDVIVKHLNEQSEHDFIVFSGTSYLIMFLIVWLFVRNIGQLIYVVLTSSLTLLLSLAIYGWLGFHLNVFTVMTPPLLIILSIINSLHVINAYTLDEIELNAEGALKRSLQKLSVPFLVALLTTSLAFLSLLSSQAIVLQEFGIFAALGACFGYSLPLFLGSIILPYTRSSKSTSFIRIFVTTCCRSVINKSQYYGIGIIMLIFIALAGLVRLQTDMYPIDYFPADHPVQQTNAFMTRYWGNYFPLELLIEAKEHGQLGSVDAVQKINSFTKVTQADPSVGTTFTYVTLMQRYSEVAFKRDLEDVLEDPLRSGKFVNQFTKSLQADSVNLLNDNLTWARFYLTGKSTGNKELSRNLDEIKVIGESTLGSDLTLSLVGYQALFIKAMKYAFDTMRSSLLLSFTLIFIIIWLMLRDFRLALIAIAPNLLPVLVLLGYMGIRSIDLDLATCTVSAIFLGIAVDDTIHILHRYKNLRINFPKMEALKRSYDEVGQVFVRTSIILVIGFSVLLAANLKTVVYLGELGMVASMSAFIGDLILVPLLIKIFHKA